MDTKERRFIVKKIAVAAFLAAVAGCSSARTMDEYFVARGRDTMDCFRFGVGVGYGASFDGFLLDRFGIGFGYKSSATYWGNGGRWVPWIWRHEVTNVYPVCWDASLYYDYGDYRLGEWWLKRRAEPWDARSSTWCLLAFGSRSTTGCVWPFDEKINETFDFGREGGLLPVARHPQNKYKFNHVGGDFSVFIGCFGIRYGIVHLEVLDWICGWFMLDPFQDDDVWPLREERKLIRIAETLKADATTADPAAVEEYMEDIKRADLLAAANQHHVLRTLRDRDYYRRPSLLIARLLYENFSTRFFMTDPYKNGRDGAARVYLRQFNIIYGDLELVLPDGGTKRAGDRLLELLDAIERAGE